MQRQILVFCKRVVDDESFAAGVVLEGSEIVVITQAASATICPVENSLERVLRIRLGNKIKTSYYVMSPKRDLSSPVFNSM